MANKFLPHTLKIGSFSIAVRDLADASCAYQDKYWELYNGNGVSTEFLAGSINIGGIEYHIDQDARVWNGDALVMEAQ